MCYLIPCVLSYHPVCCVITRALSHHPMCFLITRVLAYHPCVVSSPGTRVLSHHSRVILSPVCYLITRSITRVLSHHPVPVCYLITGVLYHHPRVILSPVCYSITITRVLFCHRCFVSSLVFITRYTYGTQETGRFAILGAARPPMAFDSFFEEVTEATDRLAARDPPTHTSLMIVTHNYPSAPRVPSDTDAL